MKPFDDNFSVDKGRSHPNQEEGKYSNRDLAACKDLLSTKPIIKDAPSEKLASLGENAKKSSTLVKTIGEVKEHVSSWQTS